MTTDSTSRRLRTQAEREAERLRQVAESRPGFATYPTTLPGDPSWWRHAGMGVGEPEIHQHRPARPPHLGPPPVDGETCKQWCGYCHLNPDPEPEREQMATGPQYDPEIWVTTEPVTQPRRRWWHRLTRRRAGYVLTRR